MLSLRGWAGLGLIALGGMGLYGVRQLMAHGGAGLLDRVDRIMAGGDGMIRLAAEARLGEDPAQRLQLFVPADPAHDPAITGRTLPVIMFIHGGGWSSGDPADYRFIARQFAPHGLAVALAGYRLGPEGRFPAMLADGATALDWIAAHGPSHGAAPANTVLMGHSAGAYNAVMLALDRRWHTPDGCVVKAVVALAGPYDFLPLDDHATLSTFGHVEDLPATQPIHHVRGDAPPLLLLHGTEDDRVRPRHSLSLARALASCGARSETHLIEGLDHEGLIMRLARPFARDRRVLDPVLDFLARTVDPASAPVQADPA